MGGSKGSTPKKLITGGATATNLASQIAGGLWQETQPFREAMYGEWRDLLSGEMPYGKSAFPAMYRAGRAPIEGQYDVARQNVMEQIPGGGRLEEALTDIEIARAQGLQDLVADYLQNQILQMYGTAFGVPQQAMQGLLGAGQLAVQAGGQIGGSASGMGGGMCCFNFLEAEGEIYSTVRRYRDEHYPKDGFVGKGYRLSASWFVPLMRRYFRFKQLIRFFMTRPIKIYTQWYYRENYYGFVFWPIAKGWANCWWLLGRGVK